MYLTSMVAKEKIGNLVVVPGGFIDSIIASTLTDPENGIELGHNPNTYDLTWTFNKGSRFVSTLREYNDIVKRAEPNNENEILSASMRVNESFDGTSIPMVLDSYNSQMEELHSKVLNLFDYFVSEMWGMTIKQGLANAVEHGSCYCEKGDVRFRFLGGESGALILIEDPGNGYDLQPIALDELNQRGRTALLLGPIKYRGTGTIVYGNTEKAVIGSEKEEDFFRLIQLYEIPGN